MKNFIVLLLLLLIIGFQAFAQNYHGKVFVDINNNGKIDLEEKVLEGVMVTDGLNVVRTDSMGSYNLPGHEKARFIYITMPDGCKAEKCYRVIDKKKLQYNFALQPYKYSNKNGFSFIQITDTETPEYDIWIDELKDYIRYNHPAFMIHTGDICYKPGLLFHAKAINGSTM